MIDSTDILIIGGGIIGCALFHRLAERSARVILIEQNQLASKTTGDSGGFIRKINTDPFINERSCESFDDYMSSAASCGFVRTGLTTRIANSQLADIYKNTASINKSNYPFTIQRVSPDSLLVYEPAAGHINTRLTCAHWVLEANRHEARHYENMEVLNLLLRGDSVCGVRTNQGDISCNKIILATGYQSMKLLQPFGINPTLSIKSFHYIIYKAAAIYLECAQLDLLDGIYLFPLSNGDLLAGYLNEDRLVDDYFLEHNLDENLASSLHCLLGQKFHWLTGLDYAIKTSFDAFTPDHHGVLDYTKIKGLILATGWSSGGIKIAPAVAKRVIQKLEE
jgi:sarcosine oxidase, subunit beta